MRWPAPLLLLAALSIPAPTLAQPAPPDPLATALIQMLQEAQQREAMALTRAVTAERQAQAAQARAAAAEAKLAELQAKKP